MLSNAGASVMRPVNWPPVRKLTSDDAKADLRGVHWALSYSAPTLRQTVTKDSYIHHGKYSKPAAVDNGDDLKASHIDMAVGVPRTCSHWQAAQSAEMSRNAAAKFSCEKPKGFEQLGEELRKSSVTFSDRKLPEQLTEQKRSFGQPEYIEQAASYAASLGKDLRASHIDVANGRDKNCGHWQGMQKFEMHEYAKEKFACKKPAGFDHLIAELRKSNVPLGGLGK
eukprot:TRINITY_DN15723_c0_g1_i2.p1 TRINITY_DN15723_c0_g1~~TRINITY_DN15723_c0_g1_i2.p1  ORF type:complete len:225 (-),score=45.93 TRINITY_DN15723_c0_g1_i2:97-771(-)